MKKFNLSIFTLISALLLTVSCQITNFDEPAVQNNQGAEKALTVTSADDAVNNSYYQALNAFRVSTKAGVWPKITKSTLISKIENSVVNPYLVNQGNSPLCGPAAIVFELVNRNPTRYVQIMQSLYETGKFTSNGKSYVTSSRLRNSDIRTGMTASDWMLMATLRENANEFFQVDSNSGDLELGVSTHGEMKDWTRDVLLLSSASIETCFVYGEYPAIRKAQTSYNNGGVAFVMVDADVLFDGGSTLTGIPTHWIGFLGNLQIADEEWWETDAEHVDYDCYTWGRKAKVCASEQRFEAGTFAVVYANQSFPKESLRPVLKVNQSFNNPVYISQGDNRIILKDGSPCTDQYFVSLQESNAYWNGIGTEVMQWVGSYFSSQIINGTFNLRDFAQRNGFVIQSKKYYRVKIAKGNPWQESTVLIYIC